jgi:hypothetical protein
MRTTVVCLGVMLAVAVQAHGCRTEGTFRKLQGFRLHHHRQPGRRSFERATERRGAGRVFVLTFWLWLNVDLFHFNFLRRA